MVRDKIMIQEYRVGTRIVLKDNKNKEKNGKNERDRIVKDRIQSKKYRKQIVFKTAMNDSMKGEIVIDRIIIVTKRVRIRIMDHVRVRVLENVRFRFIIEARN